MSKFIKILFALLLFIALTIAGLLYYATTFLDINEFKDELNSAVKKHTGRNLTIEGKLHLKLYPQLHLVLPRLALANEAGFSGYFATVEQAELTLDVWSLLQKEIKVLNINLVRPHLSLAINQSGGNNWDSLTTHQLAATASIQPVDFQYTGAATNNPLQPLAAVKLNHVKVTGGLLNFIDAQQDKAIQVSELNLTIDNFQTQTPFPITVSADIDVTDPKISAHTTLDGQLRLDTQQSLISFTGKTTESLTLPEATPMHSDMDVELQYSLKHDSLTLSKFAGNLLDLGHISLTGTAADLTTQPNAKFELTGSDITLPNQLHIDTLSTTALYQHETATLENLALALYDGQYLGNIEINHSQPVLNISAIGRLNDVQAGKLLGDLIGSHPLSGAIDFEHQLNTIGQTPEEFTQNLHGPMTLTMTDGMVDGFDISYLFQEARARTSGKENNRKNRGQTHVGHLTAQLMASNGILNNTDLSFYDTEYQANGQGTIRLSDLFVDYNMTAKLTKSDKADDLKVALPFTVTGTPDKLQVIPDFEALLQLLLNDKIKKQSHKVLDRLTDKFGKTLGEGVEDSKERGFGEELKNLDFGDLFKQ